MNTVVVEGQVVENVVLKRGEMGTDYINFSLKLESGYGTAKHQFFMECVAFSPIAERIVKAKVDAGSFIQVTGELDVKDYIRKADQSKTKIVKVTISNWCYMKTYQREKSA